MVDAGRVVVDQEERRPALVAVDDEAWKIMKSVSSGPVTNHFSPLRTYSPVAASRTAVAARVAGVGAGAVLGDRVAAGALAAQRTGRGSARAARRRSGSGRCRRPGCTTTGRRSTGRAARGRGPARWPTSPARRPRAAASRRAGRPRSRPDGSVAPVARHAPVGALELELERLEHVADERAGARLELELGRGQGQVHRGQGCRQPVAAVRPQSSRAGRGRGRRARISPAGRGP